LFGSMLGSLERLPDPQREAVEVAFGLRSGLAPDRFEVGLAMLGLLAEVAEQAPVVCIVDDAQWLDQASARTLAFVARRLMAESVALVFAVRDPADDESFAGLPELVVGGLKHEDARGLLGLAIAGRVDERVIERIVAETRGNPLALLELPRGLSAAELAGGFGVSSTQPLSARLEQSFLGRVRSMPDETQRFLLLAAAEPVGDPALLLRAADEMHATRTLSDELWGALRPLLNDQELIELCMLIGHYEMLAMTLNALRVEPESSSRVPRAVSAR